MSEVIISHFCFSRLYNSAVLHPLIIFFPLNVFIHVRWINLDYENYYPKEKKEIPKAKEQKTESKGTGPCHLA